MDNTVILCTVRFDADVIWYPEIVGDVTLYPHGPFSSICWTDEEAGIGEFD